MYINKRLLASSMRLASGNTAPKPTARSTQKPLLPQLYEGGCYGPRSSVARQRARVPKIEIRQTPAAACLGWRLLARAEGSQRADSFRKLDTNNISSSDDAERSTQHTQQKHQKRLSQ